MDDMDDVPLYDEYRLIEKMEAEVSGVWKGAHLLLFFSAFVFGSVCTFCFHMLMYLFDEQCVLFPKLLSLTSVRHNVIYEFLPENKQLKDMLPVDFLCTQWVEKSACYLPTYVPLVSGIFGLVWTTMFLMCSTGSRSLTGLQRPWRVMLPIFIFSIAMGGLCIYTSVVTHYGLQDLCDKLREITGVSNSYTVNVATLAYERRIRGVYQATRLTIIAAWMHTSCWILAALVALLRVVLVIDFHLVRINVRLVGDIDRMLENYEEHIRTVSPNVQWYDEDSADLLDVVSLFEASSVQDVLEDTSTATATATATTTNESEVDKIDTLYDNQLEEDRSKLSLVPEEQNKLEVMEKYMALPKDKRFIVKIIYSLLDKVEDVTRVKYRKKMLATKIAEKLRLIKPSTSKQKSIQSIESRGGGMVQAVPEKLALIESKSKPPPKSYGARRKSNLKSTYVQTEQKDKKKTDKKVVISDNRTSIYETDPNDPQPDDQDKETQTPAKEKQD